MFRPHSWTKMRVFSLLYNALLLQYCINIQLGLSNEHFPSKWQHSNGKSLKFKDNTLGKVIQGVDILSRHKTAVNFDKLKILACCLYDSPSELQQNITRVHLPALQYPENRNVRLRNRTTDADQKLEWHLGFMAIRQRTWRVRPGVPSRNSTDTKKCVFQQTQASWELWGTSSQIE